MGALGGLGGLVGFGAEPVPKAGLLVWLDANKVPGVADTAISPWVNMGSAGANATASGAARPTIQPDIQNNKGGMRFDGNDDELNLSYSTDLTDVTCYAVINPTNFDDFGCIAAKTTNTGNRNFYFIYRQTTGTLTIGFTSSNAVYEEQISTATLTGGQTHLVGGVFDDSADEFITDIDGTLEVTTETATIGSGSGTNIEIGHEFSDEEFLGDIFELLIWNRALSVIERTKVREYLNAKWAVY